MEVTTRTISSDVPVNSSSENEINEATTYYRDGSVFNDEVTQHPEPQTIGDNVPSDQITIHEIIPEIKEIAITEAPKTTSVKTIQGQLIVEERVPVAPENDITDSDLESSEVSEVFQRPPPVLRIGDKLLFLKRGELVPEKDASTPSPVFTIIGAEGLQRGDLDNLDHHEGIVREHAEDIEEASAVESDKEHILEHKPEHEKSEKVKTLPDGTNTDVLNTEESAKLNTSVLSYVDQLNKTELPGDITIHELIDIGDISKVTNGGQFMSNVFEKENTSRIGTHISESESIDVAVELPEDFTGTSTLDDVQEPSGHTESDDLTVNITQPINNVYEFNPINDTKDNQEVTHSQQTGNLPVVNHVHNSARLNLSMEISSGNNFNDLPKDTLPENVGFQASEIPPNENHHLDEDSKIKVEDTVQLENPAYPPIPEIMSPQGTEYTDHVDAVAEHSQLKSKQQDEDTVEGKILPDILVIRNNATLPKVNGSDSSWLKESEVPLVNVEATLPDYILKLPASGDNVEVDINVENAENIGEKQRLSLRTEQTRRFIKDNVAKDLFVGNNVKESLIGDETIKITEKHDASNKFNLEDDARKIVDKDNTTKDITWKNDAGNKLGMKNNTVEKSIYEDNIKKVSNVDDDLMKKINLKNAVTKELVPNDNFNKADILDLTSKSTLNKKHDEIEEGNDTMKESVNSNNDDDTVSTDAYMVLLEKNDFTKEVTARTDFTNKFIVEVDGESELTANVNPRKVFTNTGQNTNNFTLTGGSTSVLTTERDEFGENINVKNFVTKKLPERNERIKKLKEDDNIADALTKKGDVTKNTRNIPEENYGVKDFNVESGTSKLFSNTTEVFVDAIETERFNENNNTLRERVPSTGKDVARESDGLFEVNESFKNALPDYGTFIIGESAHENHLKKLADDDDVTSAFTQPLISTEDNGSKSTETLEITGDSGEKVTLKTLHDLTYSHKNAMDSNEDASLSDYRKDSTEKGASSEQVETLEGYDVLSMNVTTRREDKPIMDNDNFSKNDMSPKASFDDVELIDVGKSGNLTHEQEVGGAEERSDIIKRTAAYDPESEKIFQELDAELHERELVKRKSDKEEESEAEVIFKELLDEVETSTSAGKNRANDESAVLQRIGDAIAKFQLKDAGKSIDISILGIIRDFFGSRYAYE